jgi:hypothetical protein
MSTNHIISSYLKIRESDALSWSFSRDHLKNEGSEILDFFNQAASSSRSMLEYLLLSSCVLLSDLWQTLHNIPDYTKYTDPAVVDAGNLALKRIYNQILDEIRGDNRFMKIQFPMDESQFEMTSAINQFIIECSRFFKNDEPDISCASAIFMMSEAFANCGVSEVMYVDTEWFYSDELLSDIENILCNNITGEDIVELARLRIPRILPPEIQNQNKKRWRGFPSRFILNSMHPNPLS